MDSILWNVLMYIMILFKANEFMHVYMYINPSMQILLNVKSVHDYQYWFISGCALQKIKSRKATPEELKTCHSEAYVHMYSSNLHRLDRVVFGL